MQTVLITGANRGLGLGFAEQYGGSGMTVIATCRNPDEARELQTLSAERVNVTIERLDLQSDADIDALARSLESRSVTLDLIVSNAGILQGEEYGDWTRQAFADTLDTNVSGPAILAQALDEVFSRSGTLVQLSSGLGSLEWGGMGMTDADSYSVSKAALNMLTVRLSLSYQGTARCVVAMSPGWVRTEMGGAGANLTVEESVERMTSTIDSLTAKESGRFLDNEGNPIPW